MPEIETREAGVRQLMGLHLYHDPLSSCAMRVRMVLPEKSLPWVSHVVDLSRMEHATPEYQAINPNGLVPTLVHDGRTYIESMDIIRYLEEIAPTPPLLPTDPGQRVECQSLMEAADAAQVSLKVLTHEFLFRGSGRYSEEKLTKFATVHRNAWLVNFKQLFAAAGSEWEGKVTSALDVMNGHFRDLDRRLEGREWLVDGTFTLADVAWTPQVHRMSLMEWPMSGYPHLSRWYQRLRRRPSFQQAVIDCEPDGMRDLFASYVAERRREGTSVADRLERLAA